MWLSFSLALAVVSFWAAPASSSAATAPPPTGSTAAALVALGHDIFFDPALSDPHGTSCASCHDPARAFAGDNGSGAGVPRGSRPGALARRSTPSLLYLRYVPTFRFFSEEPERHALDLEPYGGFFWDGRADSIADLVRQPLLNPREMNNRDLASIAGTLRHAAYAPAFAAAFPGALDDPARAIAALGTALAAYLTSPEMAPFSSKYDDYIRGTARLTPAEARGLALFKDPKRGGCAGCHKLEDKSPEPERSLFTDFGYEVVGAPRNRKIAAEEDRGVCERTDTATPSNEAQWCASFRTPSLRNVALRPAFLHNGAFASLREVVRFYATRDTDPKRWYPSGVAYDGTPEAYRGLVNVTVAPYAGRRPGDRPAFDDGEIDAIVSFLQTLTDRKLPRR